MLHAFNFLKRRVTHFINYNTNASIVLVSLNLKFGVKSPPIIMVPFSSYFKSESTKSSRDSLHLYDHLFFIESWIGITF